jgi:(p)ppGpp synthase/HD superfamily hydrolase
MTLENLQTTSNDISSKQKIEMDIGQQLERMTRPGESRSRFLKLLNENTDEEILATKKLVEELFNGKYSKVNGTPLANHSLGVAAILAYYQQPKENILVGLLHDVIEDVENGEAKLVEK